MRRSPFIIPSARKGSSGWLTAIALLILISVFSAGCFEEWPVSPVPVQTTPATASPTPTGLPGEIVPGSPAIPLINQGYIQRPYGYTPYTIDMSQAVSIQDRGEATMDEQGRQVISGRIKNTGTQRIDHIVVTIALYNRNGEVIGNTYARLDYFVPGKVWKFQSDPITVAGVSSFEIADIFTG
jgi:hypothetical protein